MNLSNDKKYLQEKTLLTNKNNLSIPALLMLLHSDYDFIPGDTSISATTLLKPIKRLALQYQYPEYSKEEGDVSDFAASTFGNAMHAWLEAGSKSEYVVKTALQLHGFDEHNPPRMLLEQRAARDIGTFTISGKFDAVIGNTIYDLKTTSAWEWVFANKTEDYILQLSICRWLNPTLNIEDTGVVTFYFNDWQKSQAAQNPSYPQSRVLEREVTLLSLEDTEEIIKNILAKYTAAAKLQQCDMPVCSKDELWQNDTKWKYYKNPEKTKRATKVYATQFEANQRVEMEGVGIVIPLIAKAKACNWCPVISICEQAKELIANDLLDV